MADINYTGNVYLPDSGGQGVQVTAEPIGQGWSQDGSRQTEQGATPTATLGGSQNRPQNGSSVGAMTRVTGAMASLALVIGVGVWGYKLMVRDVSGVPVVRALEGPMRIQPANPGGSQADHQGLAVNAVAAVGTAAPTADRLVLAPNPVALAEEDIPRDQLATQAAAAAPIETSETKATVTQAAAEAPTPVAASDLSSMSVEDLVDALTGENKASGAPEQLVVAAPQDAQPDTSSSEVEATGAETLAEDVPAPDVDTPDLPEVVTGPGLQQSLRPMSRPAREFSSDGDSNDLAAAINSAVDTLASLDVNAETLPVGTRLAQLGAYDTPDIARMEWDKLNGRFEEYLEGKQRVIQKASSGGRTFYRLRAMGFDDLSAARRFCSALVAENTDCIPVTTR